MGVHTREQALAEDLADGLEDAKHFGLYAKLAKDYPEFELRRILGLTKEMACEQDIKNKGKYFMAILTEWKKTDKIRKLKRPAK